MQVDLTKLLTYQKKYIELKSNIEIPDDYLNNTLISNLNDIIFDGKIILNEEDEVVLTGKIKGIMTLKDDITLAPVDYNFQSELEETIDNYENILDITDILWQNILVEIPSKVRSIEGEEYPSGDGWRVISEETFEKERNMKNNPFQDLEKMLEIKEEK